MPGKPKELFEEKGGGPKATTMKPSPKGSVKAALRQKIVSMYSKMKGK